MVINVFIALLEKIRDREGNIMVTNNDGDDPKIFLSESEITSDIKDDVNIKETRRILRIK